MMYLSRFIPYSFSFSRLSEWPIRIFPVTWTNAENLQAILDIRHDYLDIRTATFRLNIATKSHFMVSFYDIDKYDGVYCF